jgi:hypothetical protein
MLEVLLSPFQAFSRGTGKKSYGRRRWSLHVTEAWKIDAVWGGSASQNNNGGVARTAFLPAVVLRRQAPFFCRFSSFSSSLLAQVGI